MGHAPAGQAVTIDFRALETVLTLRAMNGIKALPLMLPVLAAQLCAAQAVQSPQEPIAIVVDQSCRILPDSDAAVLGDHNDAFRNPVICHLESVLASRHVEERISSGDRSLVRIREHEFILQNVTDSPAVFVVRQALPEGWTVDSDPQPTTVDGETAVFRVNAEPGQVVRLHVGLRNAVPLENQGQ
jgi:hypothetical protein